MSSRSLKITHSQVQAHLQHRRCHLHPTAGTQNAAHWHIFQPHSGLITLSKVIRDYWISFSL